MLQIKRELHQNGQGEIKLEDNPLTKYSKETRKHLVPQRKINSDFQSKTLVPNLKQEENVFNGLIELKPEVSNLNENSLIINQSTLSVKEENDVESDLQRHQAWEVDHRLKHNLIIATCSDKKKSWVMKIEGLRVSLIQDFTGRMLGCRVSVYGNTFALVSDRKDLRLFHIEEYGDIVVESACDNMWEIDNINMWKNQAYVLSIEPGHVYHFLADQGIFSVCGFTINPSYSKPCHCYFWRGHVVAQILCSKELVISLSSINSHKVYEVFPQLHTSPTCLHFRGNIFLMGTDSGAVYIYTVSKEEELLNLDLCNFVKRWYVSSKGLEHLGTCRTSQGLCIIASTPHRLYTLTYPCEEL